MKQRFSQKTKGIFLALFSFLCLTSIKAQTDKTSLIANPSFETGNLNGWTWTGATGYGWLGPNTDGDETKDGSNICGIWNSSIGDAECAQTLTVANGFYKVTALATVSTNRTTTQRLFATTSGTTKSMLYGASSNAAYSPANLAILGATETYSFGGYALSSAENGPFHKLSVVKQVTDGSLKIGFRVDGKGNTLGYVFSNTTYGDAGFFKFDGFTLTEVSTVATLDNITLSAGTLDATFSPSTITYTATLPPATTTVTPTTTVTADGELVSGAGAVDVSSGTGSSTIIVTALDGTTTKTYTINYTVLIISNDATLSSLSTSHGTLSPAFDPAVTTYNVEFNSDITSVTPTAVVNEAHATVSGNGAVTISGGAGTSTISVTAQNGTTTKTYTINYYGCFTPLYSTGNIITDPYCNSYLADGWGTKSINTDPAYVYCGSSSVHINGGSSDRALNGKNGNAQMLPNTTYRVKAMVYQVSGSVQLGVYGWGGTDINHVATTTGAWETIDFTFTSGATLGDNQGIFFNNGEGYIDNWEMYEVPDINTSASRISFDEINSSESITVTGHVLSNPISITAPAGITVDPTSLPANSNGASLAVSYTGSSNVNDTITLSSGSILVKIPVTASKNSDCFTPLYPNGNLIADPYLNSLATFSGWTSGTGEKSINTDPAYVYCGSRSGKIAGTTSCSASIDRLLTGIMKVNTKYRVSAMVYAVDGAFQIGVGGWSGTLPDFTTTISTTGSWQPVDFTFTTGSTLRESTLREWQVIYFNSCVTGGGTTGYIDNWEMYEEPIQTPVIDLSVAGLAFDADNRSTTFTALGYYLTDSVRITAPAGIAIAPTALSSNGGSVTASYSAYSSITDSITFTSGSFVKKMPVVASFTKEIRTSVDSLSFDLINNGTSVMVTTNVSEPTIITAPSGITVSPDNLPINSRNAIVNVAYSGSVSVSGNITFTSGSLVKQIPVTAFAGYYLTSHLTHQWTFDDGTANDVVGTAHGTLQGGATIENKALKTSAPGQYLELPASIIAISSYPAITVETWFTATLNANTATGPNTMLSYFGDSINKAGINYYFTSPWNWSMSRSAISCGNVIIEDSINTIGYDDGLLHQMVGTVSATDMSLYIDGVSVGTSALTGNNKIANLSNHLAYLAKSGYAWDSTWIGSIHKFSLYNKVLSANDVQYLYQAGAETIFTDLNNNATSANLYPNPVTDYVTIGGIYGNATVEILDINGRILFQKKVSANESLLLSSLPQGLYIAKIITSAGCVSKKLVKR